jgi:NADH-quinone oxidoreductase subunit N
VSLDYFALFSSLRPETSLVVGALLTLALDLSIFRKHSESERLHLALAVGALALLAAFFQVWAYGAPGAVWESVFMFDRLASVARMGVLSFTLIVLGISAAGRPQRNPAEYVAILLFATTGFLLMAIAQQLLIAFLAIELASLSLYVLAGFDKTRRESAEAALKYFLFGGMAAAFLLFGFSLLYGLTGSIELPQIAAQLASQTPSPLLTVALVMVLVAFGFKSAAAPFHLWAPDVYQGAPTTSAALIASASKLAGFVIFYRLLWPGLSSAAGQIATGFGTAGWMSAAVIVSAVSMLIGNFGALAQSNVRRLLAYSAISHAGALVLGVIAAGHAGPGPLLYYATTYGLATIGAFGVIAVLARSGPCEQLSDLAGLHRRSPVLAACLAIFILSLAGIPPLAGFFGKFAVFAGALQLGGLSSPAGWLTLLAIGLSAVALYYYLLILKQALVAAPPADAPILKVHPIGMLTLVVVAILIIAFGIWPNLLLNAL